MQEKTMKTVKVPVYDAARWERYARDTPEVQSTSHLIRLAVQKELSGEYNLERRQEGDGKRDESGELLTLAQTFDTRLDKLLDMLESLEREQRSESNYDLRRAIYAALPLDPAVVNVTPVDEGRPDLTEAIERKIGRATAEELAKRLGAEQEDVRQALQELHKSTGEVEMESNGDVPSYYQKRG